MSQKHLAASRDRLDQLLESSRLMVCVGPGGVGKTTTSAALGLQAALAGRKTIVLTIDPARRLANSLGLESLTNTPQRIDLGTLAGGAADGDAKEGGELWAMMLDTKATFDELVERLAPDSGALERGRQNNIYRLLSSALHGMQEYMALEKLHDLYTGGYFDLVVLDTPPTKNALEFLRTPGRASLFFDERIIRWFLPHRFAAKGLLGRVFNAGSVVLTLISKVLGDSFVGDLTEFFDTFHYLQETLRHRGEMIEFILRDPRTAFLVISGADPRRIKEAVYFHEKLAMLEQKAQLFVVNRVFPQFESVSLPEEAARDLEERLASSGAMSSQAANELRLAMEANYAKLASLAARDRRAIDDLGKRVGTELLRLVPVLQEDVHSIRDLAYLGSLLRKASPVATPGAMHAGAE